MIGGVIMVHGDDQGLQLPPKLAPIQAVIVPIFRNDDEKSRIMPVVEALRQQLSDAIRVKVDDREETPGFKFNDWEMRGVPVRIEVGPKDVENGTVVLARRDGSSKANKSFAQQAGLAEALRSLLDTIQSDMLKCATEFRDVNTHEPKNYAEFKAVVEDGFARVWWCGDRECEAQIKEETKATTRCIPLEQPGGSGACIHCGQPAQEVAIFAKAY
jgi:prolyl-tRNA synthetase